MRHGGMGFYSMREKCNSKHAEKWELTPKEQGLCMCVWEGGLQWVEKHPGEGRILAKSDGGGDT